MGLYLKKFINSIIGLLGYKFSKLEFRKNIIAQACDLITKKNPIIFDIGSYEGETCDIFKKIFHHLQFIASSLIRLFLKK